MISLRPVCQALFARLHPALRPADRPDMWCGDGLFIVLLQIFDFALVFCDGCIQTLVSSRVARHVVRRVDVEMYTAVGQNLCHGRDGHPYHGHEAQCRQRAHLVEVVLQGHGSIYQGHARVNHDVGNLEQVFLDNSSDYFLSQIDGTRTIEDIVNILEKEFDVDRETIRNDFISFIRDLQWKRLIKLKEKRNHD